jgi:hypothetical protein
MKLNRAVITRHLNGAKSWLRSSYAGVKSFLGDVDSGIQTARTLYGAVAPLLDHAGIGQHTHAHAAKALSSYADLKARVASAHDTGEQTLQNVRQAVPQLNF